MWLSLILRNWQLVAIALLFAGLMLSITHGRSVSRERDAKIAEIQFLTDTAQIFREASERIAKETNDGIPKLVEQARKTAYANFQKKYGTGNAACGLTGRLPNLPTGTDEAHSASKPDEASTDPVADFAGQCSETTVMLVEFQRWVRLNDLPVQ